MRLLKTFEDTSSIEIAWFKALTKAKADGWGYVVTATNSYGCVQKHYFKTLEAATEFSEMAKGNKKYWKGAFDPMTINAALRQCWS